MHASAGTSSSATSPPLSASSSGGKLQAPYSKASPLDSSGNVINPNTYTVDVLNTRLLRFQAADRYAEALEWLIGQNKSPPLLDLIVEALPTLLDLASKSYQLKGHTEALLRLLSTLTLRNEQMNTTLISIAPELNQLLRLDLSSSKILPKTLEVALPHLSALLSLDVSNCPQFDDQCLLLVTKTLPRLESITLNGTAISSTSYSAFIASAASRLVSLNISGTYNLYPKPIYVTIHLFTLAGCKIKQHLVIETCQLATRLVSLDASYTMKELPEKVAETPILTLSPTLTSLHLIDCFALTNTIVFYATSVLTNLVDFSIGRLAIPSLSEHKSNPWCDRNQADFGCGRSRDCQNGATTENPFTQRPNASWRGIQ